MGIVSTRLELLLFVLLFNSCLGDGGGGAAAADGGEESFSNRGLSLEKA